MSRLDRAADAALDVTLQICGRYIPRGANVASLEGMSDVLVAELGCSAVAAAEALVGAVLRRALADGVVL